MFLIRKVILSLTCLKIKSSCYADTNSYMNMKICLLRNELKFARIAHMIYY